ncbi:MAG: myo-inosose-2 dehydratase [Opitutales bacterium]|nr:myo-inosose-2 dehydratase [Opitutales bacterium]
MLEKFRELKNPLGIHPINWSNDDFQDLGGDIPLEACFADMQAAGFDGTEVGNKYPKNPDDLRPIMDAHQLRLVGGWHSTYFGDNSYEEEEASFLSYLNFLKAMDASVVILAECSNAIHGDESQPLRFEGDLINLTDAQWKNVYEGLDRLSELAAESGIPAVYHHHMGTVVQSEAALDQLMANTSKLKLLFDTGHLAFAGIDPATVLEKYIERVGHVHLKNVRPSIVQRVRDENLSFGQAVREGVYTVPGDPEGAVDYPPLLERLADHDYADWFVIEAEQDPEKANPKEYASMARSYLRKTIGI